MMIVAGRANDGFKFKAGYEPTLCRTGANQMRGKVQNWMGGAFKKSYATRKLQAMRCDQNCRTTLRAIKKQNQHR